MISSLHKRTLLFLSLFTLLFSGVANASPLGFWPGYFGNAALNDRWGATGEVQYRAYNFEGDLQQLLIRPSISFNPLKNNRNVQVAAGFAYIRNKPLPEHEDLIPVTEEQRLFQQLILKQAFGRLNITHRYRVEERFMEGDFRMRYRYALQSQLYLNKPTAMPNAIYLSAYNELFISNVKPMFDRNRLYGGLGYCISPTLKMEAGPMWQFQESATQVQIQLMILHNFEI